VKIVCAAAAAGGDADDMMHDDCNHNITIINQGHAVVFKLCRFMRDLW
jgi:hypothetical protein